MALVLVGESSAAAGDGKLFEHVRRLHPHAKRALLVSANAWMDEPTADAIRASMALGRIDHYVFRPAASPDEVFHEAVSDFLLEWAREQRLVPQTVHIVGEEWSGPGVRAPGGLQALRRPARLLPRGLREGPHPDGDRRGRTRSCR